MLLSGSHDKASQEQKIYQGIFKKNQGVGMMKNSIFLYFFLTFFIFTGCSNNNADFLKAITDGDLTMVKSLLEDGADS